MASLAILHYFIPDNQLHYIALYSAGAFFALFSAFGHLNTSFARLFAIGTTAVMFFYFAAFFNLAPQLHEYWYRSGVGLEAVGLILSAFAMIPVLSTYSCLLKADCVEAYQPKVVTGDGKSAAFFSVPDHIEERA